MVERAKRGHRLYRLTDVDPMNPASIAKALASIDQDFERVFITLNRIGIGPPADGKKPTNIDGVLVIFTTPATGNTDLDINHKLGRVPVGLMQIELPVLQDGVSTPQAGDVYFGSLQPTDKLVTLRSNVTSKRACVLLF